ncbi:MAG: rod shape-determining protein MreC [Nitrosomonas sp.]
MKTAPPFFRHGPGPFAKLIVFTCLSCLLIVEDLRFKRFHEVRQIIGTVIFPLQRIAYAPTFIYDEVKNFIVHFNLLEENAKLRRQFLENQEYLLRFHALEAENAKLRELLGAIERIEKSTETKTILAEILYTPRDPFSHKITLNKGIYHKVQLGQAVIDDKGVIGQITRIYPFSSEVTLLTDKNHSVPVQVLRNSLRSVISGTGKNNELELRYLSINIDIQPGDLLVTSGIGGVYPPGIPVAVVEKIEHSPSDDFSRIVSNPVAGVDRNRQVLILSMMQPPVEIPAEAKN